MKNSNTNGMKRNARKDITRCICDFNPGIGDFICCDKCSVWQHMRCMGIHPKKVPQVYECELCNPRPLDKEAAIASQRQLQEEDATTSDDDDEEEVRPAKVSNNSRKGKRSNKSSSNSTESEDSSELHRPYKEIRENMYTDSVRHRVEPRTEGLPSFGSSPPGLARDQPRAGFSPQRIQYPAALQIAQHGTSKIVVNRQLLKSGSFVTDVKGHFKPTAEFYKEIGGKSLAMKRPLNYVLDYPRLDICIDTREYGNIARFIRRSCSPNCFIRSFLQEGKLHLGIYAVDSIASGAEITIPFDHPIDSYSGTFSCPCGRTECLVLQEHAKRRKVHVRTNSVDSLTSDDEHRKTKLSREEVKMQSYMKVFEKIEKDAERKRVLSENLKSPTRDVTENEEPNTPTRAAKRRRKGSGKKSRKGSGSSNNAGELSGGEEGSNTTVIEPPPSSPEPLLPVISGPRYTVMEPVLSRHMVKCNGYTADIHLRPLNVTPFSRHRRNFQLRTIQAPIVPVKMQKDGFIVPLHGSLIQPRLRNCNSNYKTSKKRWLENFLKDESSRSPKSPAARGRTDSISSNSPNKMPPTVPVLPGAPKGLTASPPCQVPLGSCSLEQATQSLNISGEEKQSPPPFIPPLAAHVPITPPAISQITPPSNLAETPVQPLTVPVTPATEEPSEPMDIGTGGDMETPRMEKKKKVTLADYRRRLQSRTKAPSISSESSGAGDMCKPVFEPISPEESADQKSHLMLEFSRPSLSESLSEDPIVQPTKVRKVEGSNGIHTTPQLSTETFSRIKEILSQNQTTPTNGLKSSALYDPNSKQHQLISQLSDEVFDGRGTDS